MSINDFTFTRADRIVLYVADCQLLHTLTRLRVMGPSGVGKTTFVNYAVRRGARGVNHSLQSDSTKLRFFRTEERSGPNVPPQSLVFVDTPGFDDANKSDIEILTMVAEFLVKAYV